MKKYQLNLLHLYVPIAIALGILSFIFRYQKNTQLLLLFSGILSYLVITLFHHKKDKSLTFQTIVEYILVASLAILIVLSLNLI